MCPSLSPPPGFFLYTSPTGQPLTGGYGYNKAVGNRKIVQIPSTSATYLFCDSALLACSPGQPCSMQESDAIVGPVPLVTNASWGLYQALTHFRHTTVGNMAFLDGHVEPLTLDYAPSDPSWPGDAVPYTQKYRLGFPTTSNSPYQADGT